MCTKGGHLFTKPGVQALPPYYNDTPGIVELIEFEAIIAPHFMNYGFLMRYLCFDMLLHHFKNLDFPSGVTA